MSDGLDDDIGLARRFQVPDPTIARGPDGMINPEPGADRRTVHRIDTGDPSGTERLCHIGEQQSDRALADDRHVAAFQIRQLLERVEDTGQRLQTDRQLRGQSRVVGHQPVAAGDHAAHQTVEARSPTHHTLPGRWSGWRLASTSPAISWIGNPVISAAQHPVSPATCPGCREIPGDRCRRSRRPENPAAPGRRSATPVTALKYPAAQMYTERRAGMTTRHTSTGMLFQPHWKLEGGRDAAASSMW